LPLGEHHEVAEHFESCPACARFKAAHEAPPPPLPPIPEFILTQFGRDLDAAIADGIAQLQRARQHPPRMSDRLVQIPRSWVWFGGALLSATTSAALFGLVQLQAIRSEAERHALSSYARYQRDDGADLALIDYAAPASYGDAIPPCQPSSDGYPGPTDEQCWTYLSSDHLDFAPRYVTTLSNMGRDTPSRAPSRASH
jgi:hypothetical protein